MGQGVVFVTHQDDHHKPRLSGQVNGHQPNPEWPNWGRDALDHGHAIFAIAAHLRTLGLSSWFERLSAWLARYDGFEKYVDEGCDPFICVRDALAGVVLQIKGGRGQRKRTAVLKEVVEVILAQEFLRYVAYWGRGLVHDRDARVWNPLAEPWMEFLEQGADGQELIVWRAFELPLRPSLAQHRAALRAG